MVSERGLEVLRAIVQDYVASREPAPLRIGRIVNIDHHAPLPEMERPITSTKLAFEYLAAGCEPES